MKGFEQPNGAMGAPLHDCQHIWFDIKASGLHMQEANNIVSHAMRVTAACANCGRAFRLGRNFHINEEGNGGGEYLYVALIPAVPPKSAPATAPVVELEPTAPSQGTAAQTEHAKIILFGWAEDGPMLVSANYGRWNYMMRIPVAEWHAEHGGQDWHPAVDRRCAAHADSVLGDGNGIIAGPAIVEDTPCTP